MNSSCPMIISADATDSFASPDEQVLKFISPHVQIG